MAYCLISLIETLERMLHPDQHHLNWILDQDKLPQIQTIFSKVSSVGDFFRKRVPLRPDIMEMLEDKVKDVAEEAQDILELHITGQIISSPRSQSFFISPPDAELQAVNAGFESVLEAIHKVVNDVPIGGGGGGGYAGGSQKVLDTGSAASPALLKDKVVGVEQDLKDLRDRLTSRDQSLQIIPIVGMGGMGKTTLARILHDEFSSSEFRHFNICGWSTVSQEYSPEKILQTLIQSVPSNSVNKPSNLLKSEELVVKLNQSLSNRRYLIVLDDVWSPRVWDDVKWAFPDDKKGSRIILTTREKIMADYVNPKSHQMRLLSKDDSQKLLVKKVYGGGSWPAELEQVGERIAKSLKGLPLAIDVVGGLLAKAKRSKDSWEQIELNVRSSVADTGSGIFSLSYDYLPYHLKPCFLYMAAFPEDSKISVSHITYLWIAEGFLTPIQDVTLEEAAERYLKDLTDRNLIVCERGFIGEVVYYGIHDLLRELCLTKAREKKFLSDDASSLRRVSLIRSRNDLKLTSLTRSFRCEQRAGRNMLSSLCLELSLLRVLDISTVEFQKFPEEILQLVNLRFLHLSDSFGGEIPEGISMLRNLQVLWAKYSVIRSIALIFDLPELRHLMFSGIIKDDSFQVDDATPVQENLQILSTVTETTVAQLLGKLPNLKELGIDNSRLTTTPKNVVDMTCFSKLERLKFAECEFNNFIFPDSVKELRLVVCCISSEDMNKFGALPNLESLKVEICWWEKDEGDSTWVTSEDQFCELRYIEFFKFDLDDWFVEESHFPVLEHLVIHYCSFLKDIPHEIGLIDTLKTLRVNACLPSVHIAAETIRLYKQESGDDIQAQIGKDYNTMFKKQEVEDNIHMS